MKRLVVFLSLLITLSPNFAHAEDITIAAAADLNFAFKELIPQYEQATGTHVKLSLGSSGNFFAQIQHGAPFDLYFSADSSYPQKLEEAGLTVPGSLYRYAVGRIVLWARHELPVRRDTRAPDPSPTVHQKDRHCQPHTCAIRPRGSRRDATFQHLRRGQRPVGPGGKCLSGRAIR
ncbi:MAG: molybdate ABC transporter substrate-binding protein [Nitrospira sp.]|nr:molybdate ABC transporter substrate-binding protein [Nitrospira sp.]